MKHSLIFFSLLTVEVLSRPVDPKFRRRYIDPDFGFDLGRFGRSSLSPSLDELFHYSGASSNIPFGSGAISLGSPGSIGGPTFASPPALDVASAAPGTLPPIPETPASPPVSPAPVDPGAPVAAAAPAPVDPAAPASPAPVDPAAPASPAPVDPPAPASPAPVDPAPVSPAPVDGAAPVSPAPVDGAVAVSPAPVDGAAPATPPTFSEPPPLDVASAAPDVNVDPSTFQAPGAATPPASPETPPSPDTPVAPVTPGTGGTAADLGNIAAVNADPTNPNSGAVQNAIDSFNQNVAPGLEQGRPVDHSGDKDIKLGIDLFNGKHGGRSGITLGNKDVQVGVYRDFNPLKPLDTFDGSKPHRPTVFGIKANF